MNKCGFMNKKVERVEFEAFVEDAISSDSETSFIRNNRLIIGLLGLLVLVPLFFASRALWNGNTVSISSEDAVKMVSAPAAATSTLRSTISIPAGTVKANPFLPYKDIKAGQELDIPGFTLVEPPEILDEVSEASRLMNTVVSGILYDKYSPSAILNIEGNDYLVKKGDVVNNYKIVNIMQDSVTVKLGTNVYKAGIGEILTEGKLNHNDVSNLNNKFGGER